MQTQSLTVEDRHHSSAGLQAFTPEPAIPSPALGECLGRYTLRAYLGAGGMGEVYAAHDPELDRVVAVKVLRTCDGDATPTAIARFQREVLAMARLNHPNVVSVFDAGRVGDRVFVAMELVEGPTLASWLADRPRSWREVVGVFLQAGRGLAAVHAAGIVHRDFKPSNVIVGDRVRIADFGLAKSTAARDSLSSPSVATVPLDVAITSTGASVGTPAYMAPEQRAGGAVTARADQYSYCVALREALAGHGPRDGSVEDRFAVRAPRFLRAVVARGLASDPGDRFPSMAALLEVLERGGSPSAYVGPFGRADATEPRIESLAVLPLDNLSGDPAQEYIADGLTEAVIAELGKLGSLRVIDVRAAREFLTALRLNPSSDQAHSRFAHVAAHVGLFDEALQHAASALEINPLNAQARHTQAEALLWRGHDEDALYMYRSIPEPVLPELVEANTIFALLRLKRRGEATSRLRLARAKYPDDVSGSLDGIQALLLADSEPDRAMALIESVKQSKPVDPAHHAAHFAACACAHMRRPEEAVDWLREAAETGFPCYACFARDPNLAPIRQDPGFQAFMAELRRQSESLQRALLSARP